MITLNELTWQHVDGFNRRAIAESLRKNTGSTASNVLTKASELKSCLGGIFYQAQQGYLHLPIEKMAGLLLYRIAEGQFFLDGNKRTALLACYFFLHDNGLSLRTEEDEVNDLMWGFAKDHVTGIAKYNQTDAIQFIFENVLPRI